MKEKNIKGQEDVQSWADHHMVDREWLEQAMASQETRGHLFLTGSDLLLSEPPNNVTYYGSINNLTYLLMQRPHGIVPGNPQRHSQMCAPLIPDIQ